MDNLQERGRFQIQPHQKGLNKMQQDSAYMEAREVRARQASYARKQTAAHQAISDFYTEEQAKRMSDAELQVSNEMLNLAHKAIDNLPPSKRRELVKVLRLADNAFRHDD